MVTITPSAVVLRSVVGTPTIPVPDQAFLITCTPYSLPCVDQVVRTWDTNRSANKLIWGRADGVEDVADGTRVFLGSNLAPAQHDVDVAWSIPTGTVPPNAGALADQGSVSSAIFFMRLDNGTRGYRGDEDQTGTTRKWHGFPLSTAWDLTTAGSIDQTLTVSAPGASGHLEFSVADDGSALYHIAAGTGSVGAAIIVQRAMTTAYDISTAFSGSAAGIQINFRAYWANNEGPKRWYWKPEGDKFYVVHGTAPDTTAQYDVPTAFDITSITTSGTDTIGVPIAQAEETVRHPEIGVTGGSSHTIFGFGGARMYVVDAAGTDVWQFPVLFPADVDVTDAAGAGGPVCLLITPLAPEISASIPSVGVPAGGGKAGRPPQRVGRYWVQDDESGLIYWDDDMVKQWDGSIRHWRSYETRQPQEFVQALNDPLSLRHVRPDDVVATPDLQAPRKVGETTVSTAVAPAGHIFGQPQFPQPVSRALSSPVQLSVLVPTPTISAG